MAGNRFDAGVKKKLLGRYKVCELCGNDRNLEIHHIIPLCAGGSTSVDNLIVICGVCHAKLTPRSELTKLGMRKKSYIPCYEFFRRCDDEEPTSVAEVLDIALELMRMN